MGDITHMHRPRCQADDAVEDGPVLEGHQVLGLGSVGAVEQPGGEGEGSRKTEVSGKAKEHDREMQQRKVDI